MHSTEIVGKAATFLFKATLVIEMPRVDSKARIMSGHRTDAMAYTLTRMYSQGICMVGGFESTGSQISTLPMAATAVHSFTTSTRPDIGCYKPFSFTSSGGVGAGGSTKEIWNAYKKATNSKVKHHT